MIVLINVTISNTFDSSTRNVILYCDAADVDSLNNVESMADVFVDLCEYSNENIIRIERVKPINISSNKKYSDKIDGVII